MIKINQLYRKILERINTFLNSKISNLKRVEKPNNIEEDYLMKKIYSLLDKANEIKSLLKLHEYIYKKISLKATKNNKGIHPKHRILNLHQFFLNNIEVGTRILDIGCGNGFLTYSLAEKAQEVVGIDNSITKIKTAKKRFSRKNIKYIYADATKYQFKENFDYIILSNILEHIKKRQEFLTKIKTMSNFILIRVPMINSSWISVYKAEISLEHLYNRGHFIEYTFETFQKEIHVAGLKILAYDIQFGEIWAKIGTK